VISGVREAVLVEAHMADDIVRRFPELKRGDVVQAAGYGSWLAGERTLATA
jgi:hypothetical protein